MSTRCHLFTYAVCALLAVAGTLRAGPLFEVDTFTLPTTNNSSPFQSVTFNQSYDQTPLVFLVATNEGGDPCAIRIRNVTKTGFEAVQAEPRDKDGTHGAMTDVAYFAIVPGRWEIQPGVHIEAGGVSTSQIQRKSGGGWDPQSFLAAMPSTPVLQAFIQTMNSESNSLPSDPSVPWMTTAIRNVSTGGFDVALERAEAYGDGGTVVAEQVGYVALTAGPGTLDGNGGGYTIDGSGSVLFDALQSAAVIDGWTDQDPDGDGVPISFIQTFASAPLVVASTASRNGDDGGWLRRGAVTAADVKLTLDEDTFNDSERGHASAEAAGIFAFERAFTAATPTSVDVCWDAGTEDVVSPVRPTPDDGSTPYPGDGKWRTNTNWRVDLNAQNQPPNDVLPSALDRVNISLEDNAVQAPVEVGAGDDFEVNSLRLGINPGLGVGGHGRLNITGGELRIRDNGGKGVGGQMELGLNDRTGYLTITGGVLDVQNALILGNSSGGTGRVTVDGGALKAGTIQSGSGTAVINVVSGAVEAGTIILGGPNATTINQDGGTVTVAGNLEYGPGGTGKGGTYNLSGGTLTVGGEILETAPGVDSAQLHLDGGTLNVAGNITVQRFALAQASGTSASYTVAAGKILTTTGTLAVGSSGAGLLTVPAGGTLVIENSVIGETGSGDGTLRIDGGTAGFNSYLRVGVSGTGTLELIDGTLNANGGLNLATNNSGSGSLIIGTSGGSTSPVLNVSGGNFETAENGTGVVVMHSGTFNQTSNNLIVGQNSTCDASFTLHDGLVDIQGQLRVSNKGKGVFIQNGGTVNVGAQLDLANDANNDADARYTMNGGVLNVGDETTSNLVIGNANRAGSKALMEILDGTVTVSNGIRIADTGANSSGTLIIGDGTTSPTVTIGGQFEAADNRTGVFTFRSGTLTENGGNFITGQGAGTDATVTIGGYATPAVFNLTGGDGQRDWNTNGGHGLVTVLAGGTVNVGRTLNMGNNSDANCGLELTINGGTVNIGAAVAGNLDYRNNGPKDQINLQAGTLNLNGGTIFLRDASAGQFSFTGGRLLNVGVFNGTLVQAGGTLAPGGSAGTTTINGGYTQLAGGTLEMELTLAGNDLLVVNGPVDLAGQLLLLADYDVPENTHILLIDSDEAISGQFENLPEGTWFGVPGVTAGFAITYAGGPDGFNVELTAVPEPATMGLLALAGGALGGYIRRRRS